MGENDEVEVVGILRRCNVCQRRTLHVGGRCHEEHPIPKPPATVESLATGNKARDAWTAGLYVVVLVMGMIGYVMFRKIMALEESARDGALADLRMDVAGIKSDLDAATRRASQSDTEVIAEQIKNLGRSRETHTSEFARIEAILDTSGHFDGWWCGVAEVCGRTQRECASHDARTLTMSGPQETGARCARQKTAWCVDGEGMLAACSPTRAFCMRQASKCVEVE